MLLNFNFVASIYKGLEILSDMKKNGFLLAALLFVFFLGIDYLGGFNIFWDLLPTTWKLPLADFNEPSSFNFVGIFWQDGIAGSIGFLFMNMGLIMRFMATKSVDEGRKAAAFNILFMLPLSAVVVGGAGWLGKAISVSNPEVVPPNTAPDQIFVVVANIIAQPGVFGFIMAALTAALMSTVDTLINATAAIYINDVHRPIKKVLKHIVLSDRETEKKELFAARMSSVAITIMGVLAVLAFRDFPTVYEAHGYFHSTLTPPLVVAIFLGIFWRRFTPAAVIATFVGGVALMILGARYPGILISPFDHGIEMDPLHPYSYIRALYNTFVCSAVAVIVTLTTVYQEKIIKKINGYSNGKQIMSYLTGFSVIIFLLITFNVGAWQILLFAALVLTLIVALSATYYIPYNQEEKTLGLTSWSIDKAKEMFKGSKLNEREGSKVTVEWKFKEGDEDVVYFSKKEMELMAAEVGDLVYVTDARKYLGGLKSVHSIYGTPHDEEGVVYMTDENIQQGQFIKGKAVIAEKEM